MEAWESLDIFARSLEANFPCTPGFVSECAAAEAKAGESNRTFLVLCARRPGASAGGELSAENLADLRLQVTDCVEGVFRATLGLRELDQLRHDAGMAEFEWSAFLQLFASALRGEGGCSAEVSLVPNDVGDAATHRAANLSLRFKLEAASLVGSVMLPAAGALSQEVLPQAESFLSELRSFVLGAVSAAGSTSSRHAVSPRTLVPTNAPPVSLGFSPLRGSQGTGASQLDPLDRFSHGASVLPASAAAAGSSAKAPPAAKKRAAASLVDPHARRTRRAGANPFQLS